MLSETSMSTTLLNSSTWSSCKTNPDTRAVLVECKEVSWVVKLKVINLMMANNINVVVVDSTEVVVAIKEVAEEACRREATKTAREDTKTTTISRIEDQTSTTTMVKWDTISTRTTCQWACLISSKWVSNLHSSSKWVSNHLSNRWWCNNSSSSRCLNNKRLQCNFQTSMCLNSTNCRVMKEITLLVTTFTRPSTTSMVIDSHQQLLVCSSMSPLSISSCCWRRTSTSRPRHARPMSCSFNPWRTRSNKCNSRLLRTNENADAIKDL